MNRNKGTSVSCDQFVTHENDYNDLVDFFKEEKKDIFSFSLDPRTKILVLIFINLISLSLNRLEIEAALIILICLALLWQKMFKTCFKYLVVYSLTIAVFIISLKYQNSLTAMLAILCIIIRKTLPVFMFASSLISKTKVSQLIAAMQKVKVPKGIIIVFAIIIRFFPTLKEEFVLVTDAMKVRGIRFSFINLFFKPIMLTESVIIPIMMRISSIAEELSAASITRGIDSKTERTSYYEVSLNFADYLFLSLFFLLTITSFIL